MIGHKGENLVFLLCVPRSGSSLSTVMLQNHSEVFATQEMWFLMSLYDLQFSQSRPYGGREIVQQFFKGVLPGEMFENACRAFALEVYNGLLQSSGGKMVVDKSPRYYYLLEFLDRLFPQSHRIWLVRNPLAIVSSYKKVYSHRGASFNLMEDLLNPEFSIKMADITVGLFRYYHYFSAHHPLAYKLSYEQLVMDPKGQMERLCEFLGISYEEGIERYGSFMNSPKSDMFFSMGAGDPYLGQHQEAHHDSLHSWKDILTKEEVELYCRTLGARIFHDLGYSDVLAEAEAMTGVTFPQEPNAELLQLRSSQLAEASGCRWEEAYRLRSDAEVGTSLLVPAGAAAGPEAGAAASTALNPEVLQLKITLRALEQRLEKNYAEQEKLKAKLKAMKHKINRVKSMVPFGNKLSRWASAYLVGGKKS